MCQGDIRHLDANGNDKSTSIDNAAKSILRAKMYLADDSEQTHTRKLFRKAVEYGKLDILQWAQ